MVFIITIIMEFAKLVIIEQVLDHHTQINLINLFIMVLAIKQVGEQEQVEHFIMVEG